MTCRNFLLLCIIGSWISHHTYAYPGDEPVNGNPDKAHAFNKEIAPAVDIAPKLVMAHDIERVRAEMEAIRSLGFKRVYLVLCNPGYPSFANPVISPTALHGSSNRTLESLLRLGDPNWVYLNEAKKQGLEVWAVFKPYESGTGNTIPHGQVAPLSMTHLQTIGGQYIHFDNLLSQHPQFAVKRKPADKDMQQRADQEIASLELSFCIDAFTQRVGPRKEIRHKALTPGNIRMPVFELWTSADNGSYVPCKIGFRQSVTTEMRYVSDANNRKLFEEKKNHLVIRLDHLALPDDHSYLSLVQKAGDQLSILPYSMIRAYGDRGEIPLTIATYSRRPHYAHRKNRDQGHQWGNEGLPVKGQEAVKWFPEMGFEFEWYGVGFWGNGWTRSPVFGLAKGKRTQMKGTPCEAHAEVRHYWLDFVRRVMDMGFDGVDFRLQNHSGMVTDYLAYGYNEPVIEQYKRQYGIDILKQPPDPLKIMKIRGDYYYQFLQEAADMIRGEYGKKVKVHLRHADQDTIVGDDWNELGFWAMPKILVDWKKMVDLADEITLKHYYFNKYDPEKARLIKAYAGVHGKPVWVHAYLQQGNEGNAAFLQDIEKDDSVSGIIMYEFVNSFFSNRHPVYNMKNMEKLLREIGYRSFFQDNSVYIRGK